MKAAFSVWDDRIAPVFDVGRHMLLVEAKSGCVISESKKVLDDTIPVRTAALLAELNVEVLVCGAISRSLQEMIESYGIRVLPFVAGNLREVMNAWLSGKRDIALFAMPGCCKRVRRICASQDAGREVYVMRERRGGGMGSGRGPGRGGRMGGPLAAGPGGNCICPQCGHKEPHQVGIPCAQKQCPKCGAVMVRE